jgi:hypothetical protein
MGKQRLRSVRSNLHHVRPDTLDLVCDITSRVTGMHPIVTSIIYVLLLTLNYSSVKL